MEAHIHAIWISPGHDFKGRHGQKRKRHAVERLDEAACHAGKGIVGDRFYAQKPDLKGQITFFSLEVANAVQQALGLDELDASAFRRNVLVSGMDLNSLVGRVFTLGGVRFEGVEECAPCYWMDEAVGSGTFALLKERGGLRCRILTDGVLRPGACSVETDPA
jgi:MOSC domain-containing protein YiiM